MKASDLSIRIMIVGSALMTAVELFPQQPGSSEGYVPQIGQKGKDVVWVPTPQVLVDRMLELAKVTPEDFVIDLGSGDGRTVISAARIGARALGVEYNPDMVALSRENAKKAGTGEMAQFVQADLFDVNLSGATVITMFLLPEINLRLRPRLLELRPGTRIVSNTFTMGDWEPDFKVTTEENWNSWNEAHLWIIPAKVEGTWKAGDEVLNLSQKYQMVSGTISSEAKSFQISDGRLRGEVIIFTAGGKHYNGLVKNDKITGTVTTDSDGKAGIWVAERVSGN